MKKLTLILCFFTCVQQLCAQQDTTFVQPSKTNTIVRIAVPTALISYGVITRFTPALQDFDHRIDAKINTNRHSYHFDDYIQYAPYAAIYGLDWCGVRAKHSFWERSFVVGTAVVLMGTSVTLTKHFTNIERPDKSNFRSFPSGHTATAFVGAHILFREYKDVSPWIGISGYAVAVTTGTMRMVNHKHWLSDVVTGAGVGILAAELSYQLLPVWRKMFRLQPRENPFSFAPVVLPQYCGVGVNLKL
ncbi:MAG: phosphatase PAP2 family protein [Bacteroidetes bacterium]|nr:phosphatase PAP2 family protein [Bacteroidota bacterium]